MPAHRYRRGGAADRRRCVAKYGLRYNTGSLFRQYLTVMKRILVNTLPPKASVA